MFLDTDIDDEVEIIDRTKVTAGGIATKAQGAGAKVLPDSVNAGMHRSMAEPGSAHA